MYNMVLSVFLLVMWEISDQINKRKTVLKAYNALFKNNLCIFSFRIIQ